MNISHCEWLITGHKKTLEKHEKKLGANFGAKAKKKSSNLKE
jgi:hypothetical protein